MIQFRSALTRVVALSLLTSGSAPVGFLPGTAKASSSPPKFEFTVKNQTGARIQVRAFNNDDLIRAIPASEVTIGPKAEGRLSCNTNSSCHVSMGFEKPQGDSVRSTSPVSMDFNNNYTMSFSIKNWSSSCLSLKPRIASQPNYFGGFAADLGC